MKFATCNEMFEGWEFARVCQFVRTAGYDGLEVAPFTLASRVTDLTPGQLDELRRKAADAEIQIIGLHWLLARTEGMHLTSPDSAARDRLAIYLVDLARACQALGGHLMVFGSPQQRSLAPGTDPEQAFERAARVFRQALPAIADHGVTLCMEPLSPVETDFINTCEEGMRLIEAVAHPNFVLHLDVKAMCSEPTPVAELIRRYGGAAGHFHANDANLRGPGFGETDFVPIFDALGQSGYEGWVSVEVFDYSPDPETIATRSLEYMRSCE